MADEQRIDALEQRLRRIEDERAILQTLYTYGHAIDYDDEAAFADCWTEDAVLEWPWREPIEGREAILGAFRAHTHAPAVYHKHFMVEPQVELDGDRASVHCMYARLDRDDTGAPYLRSFGRYIDALVRGSDGRWRFQRRRAENEAVARRHTRS
jgi:ketosteroid isomerase-like protein